MSDKTIRIIIITMLATSAALFITQAYWFNKSFILQEQQFDDKINIALRNVAHQLLLSDGDSTSRIAPVSKISSNEYWVETNCYFNLNELDNQIRKEFIERNIDVDFDYLIINPENESILLGNSLNDLFDTSAVACKTRLDDKSNLNFKVRIHNKTTYILNSMGIWIFSSLSLIGLLVVFIFIMVSIIRGKKLAILKKDFVNNMTHELKTPIANISVASEAIRNQSIQMDERKLKKYADIIYKENVRLHHLVDRVLQISAIEKKDESLSFEVINLNEIIRNILLNFEPLIQKRKGKLNSDLKASHFRFRADKTHLSNVIYNLIENAIKYSKNTPEIALSTANINGGIEIKVSDKGIGISKENQKKIFDQFFRAESGNLHDTKGYGLGLSYVKLIVEKHKGSVTFSSVENEGSSFNIFIPFN